MAALAESLTLDEGKELFKDTSLGGYLDKRNELIDKQKMSKTRYIMRPIAEVLTDFSDSKSGKRREARKELQFRFDTQAWKDQIGILTVMLQTDTKIDTAWVAKLLSGDCYMNLDYLFNCFPDNYNGFWDLLYKRCEEHFSHPAVAAFMVDHMPNEYVDRHLEELERIIGYRKLCLRLARSIDYAIDESKLTLFQYLDVLSKSYRTPKQQAVWDKLCDWFRKVDANEVSWESGSRFGWAEHADASILSLTDLSDIRWFVKSCGALHLTGLICAVYDLDQRVKARLQETKEREATVRQMSTDPLMAGAHYKKLLIQFAKEEIDNVDTSSLPKDVTVMQRLKPTFDRLGIVTQPQPDGEFLIEFLGNKALMGTNDFNNTYYFKKALPKSCSREAFLDAVSKVKENPQYQRLIDGLWTNTHALLYSHGMPVFHEGIAAPIFRSNWRYFLSAYEMVLKELDMIETPKP